MSDNSSQTRLGIITFRLSNFGREVEALLGYGECLAGVGELRGRDKTVGDVVRPDGEGGMSVVDGFGARCFRKKVFS